MGTEKQQKYSEELKQTRVNLYHSGKPYAQIHKEYGVSSSNWKCTPRTSSRFAHHAALP